VPAQLRHAPDQAQHQGEEERVHPRQQRQAHQRAEHDRLAPRQVDAVREPVPVRDRGKQHHRLDGRLQPGPVQPEHPRAG